MHEQPSTFITADDLPDQEAVGYSNWRQRKDPSKASNHQTRVRNPETDKWMLVSRDNYKKRYEQPVESVETPQATIEYETVAQEAAAIEQPLGVNIEDVRQAVEKEVVEGDSASLERMLSDLSMLRKNYTERIGGHEDETTAAIDALKAKVIIRHSELTVGERAMKEPTDNHQEVLRAWLQSEKEKENTALAGTPMENDDSEGDYQLYSRTWPKKNIFAKEDRLRYKKLEFEKVEKKRNFRLIKNVGRIAAVALTLFLASDRQTTIPAAGNTTPIESGSPAATVFEEESLAIAELTEAVTFTMPGETATSTGSRVTETPMPTLTSTSAIEQSTVTSTSSTRIGPLGTITPPKTSVKTEVAPEATATAASTLAPVETPTNAPTPPIERMPTATPTEESTIGTSEEAQPTAEAAGSDSTSTRIIGPEAVGFVDPPAPGESSETSESVVNLNENEGQFILDQNLIAKIEVQPGDGVTQVLGRILARAGYTEVSPNQLYTLYEELVTNPAVGPDDVFIGVTLVYNQDTGEYDIQDTGEAYLTDAAAELVQRTIPTLEQ